MKKTKERARQPSVSDPYEKHLLTFKVEACKAGCENVYDCPKFHSCEDRRRPVTVNSANGLPNYVPNMCNDAKGTAVRIGRGALLVFCYTTSISREPT